MRSLLIFIHYMQLIFFFVFLFFLNLQNASFDYNGTNLNWNKISCAVLGMLLKVNHHKDFV